MSFVLVQIRVFFDTEVAMVSKGKSEPEVNKLASLRIPDKARHCPVRRASEMQ